MAEVTESFLRDQLVARQEKLQSAITLSPRAEGLMQLLKEVDSALERMEAGTYGLCGACHEPIEKDRLLANPLVCYCLDHLTFDQQRALEQDLEMAARVQRELLPKQDLSFAGWQTSYHYEPAGPVSGDYCDLVIHENESQGLFFALGDVSGKGVAASMLMAHLHAIFRTLIATSLPVHELLERASRIFCESTMSTLFATLVCGRAGISGEVEVCNAGHCPALLLRREEVIRIESTGVPLGMFCAGHYSPQKMRLAPGDTLFLYSDGLSEARSATDEEYGEGRLTQVLMQGHSLPPRALIQACIEDVAAFRSGAPLADDLTVMAVHRVA
jgi:sigma-B regulation protein RsbU (phosphoserine phosphatase)